MWGILIAVVTIGSPPCQSVPMVWQVEYTDGVVQEYSAPGGQLTFEPRPYRNWRARSQNSSGWGEWTVWQEVEHYPGDLNGNCVVSGSEVNEVAARFGEQCP